ncbi:MAG: N-acetylglucosamine kinase [Bacteroidota bacterium]
MLLVADSGSTKCDWRLVKQDKSEVDFHTMGINPFFHDEVLIENELTRQEQILRYKNEVLNVFFYGAGSSSEYYQSIVQRGLSRVFVNSDILVSHDLNGAAYSTWNGSPGITCIIGTGSNSCYFDGNFVSEKVPALGYILGDEASGSYHGKKLLTDFLYDKLPLEIETALKEDLKITKASIFENVYQKPNANVYLASFMKFIARFKGHEYVENMMLKGFRHFIQEHIKCFDNHDKVPSHFVGSVAYHFQDELRKAAFEEGIEVGSIIKKPIDGLVDFHFKYMNEKIRF